MDSIIIFFASYLAYIMAAAVIFFSFWPRRRFRMLAAALVSGGTTLIIKKIIVFFWHRPRPFVVLHTTPLISAKGEEFQSFPSGHALFFFALAMAVYRYDKKLGRWFFAGATVMGIARVAAGVHWPSDILAGAVIGILVAQLITRIPALSPRHA